MHHVDCLYPIKSGTALRSGYYTLLQIHGVGPDGGLRGGDIVAEGTPEDVAANPSSATGRFLLNVPEIRERVEGRARRQEKGRAARVA